MATRDDTELVVSFDTPLGHTRRPDKFERIVRETLPQVFGPAVKTPLARIPDGQLAAQGDLLNELPSRGVVIPVDSTWMIRLYPETRDGRDGPLVVRYRVFVVPTRP